MNLKLESKNSSDNSIKAVDFPSSSSEVLVQVKNAFSSEAGLQLTGPSSTPATANEPLQSNEYRRKALIQDVSGPAILRSSSSSESSAPAERSWEGKSFSERQSFCSAATPFTGQQWTPPSESFGQSPCQNCFAGGSNNAQPSPQHNGQSRGCGTNAGKLQSASVLAGVLGDSESSKSVSSRPEPEVSSKIEWSRASANESQQSKQSKMGETTASKCNPERNQFSGKLSEPFTSVGNLTEWKQQHSASLEPGSCQFTESLQTTGVLSQRATLEETPDRLGSRRSLGRETQQASITWESPNNGSKPASGLSSRHRFDGNSSSPDGSPSKDIARQGQSVKQYSTTVEQGSSSSISRSISEDEKSIQSCTKGLCQSNTEQCTVKLLGAPISCRSLEPQGFDIHEGYTTVRGSPDVEGSLVKGSPVDEGSSVDGSSFSIKGASLVQRLSSIEGSSIIKGSTSDTQSSSIKGSPFIKGSSNFEGTTPIKGSSSIAGLSLIQRSPIIKRSINERCCDKGSSSSQRSFTKELPELEGSPTIEGSPAVTGFPCIQESSFVAGPCVSQELPPVQGPDFEESIPGPGSGSSPISDQLSLRGPKWSGAAVSPVGGGTTSTVITESPPSSPVRITTPAKHGTWPTAFTGSPKSVIAEPTTSTVVGSTSPRTYGRTSSIIDESHSTFGDGSPPIAAGSPSRETGLCSGCSVQTLPGIPVRSPSQIVVGSPSRSFKQSFSGASLGTSAGAPTRTCPGVSSGSSRASVGSPSRASAGSPTGASTGSPTRVSVGSPSRAFARLPSGASAQSSRGLTQGATPRTNLESSAAGNGPPSSTSIGESSPVALGSASPAAAVGCATQNLVGLSGSHGQTTVPSSIVGRSAGQANGRPPQLASATAPSESSLPAEQAGSLGASSRGAIGSTASRCLESRGERGDEQHAWERTELGIDDEGEAPPTTETAKGIKAIDRAAVHHICSGQVVVSLATAVKELVENSLDAGSSSVEVRLTACGATSITVTDDGPGVHPNDFQALALKHHTSKLRDFDGLTGVETFGFRGEALSSLCSLSKLTVCTRHQSQAVGSTLVYDSNGVLTENVPVSRQVGTTVTLLGLFTSLPVRRREFERNIKKEYHKLLQVLQSYAIIATNVRLHVSNQFDAGSRRNTVLATSGHPTLLENVTAVFGAKQVSSLVPLQQSTITEEDLTEYRIPHAAVQDGAAFTIEGLISSSRHGGGRSAPDRQFYFINSRPCDPTKVSRLVNEVYRNYNRHQYPCVVLNVITERQCVDVNLTPDKRQVMVHHERLLLATLKSSLRRLFDDTPHTISLNTKHSASKSKPSRGTLLQQTLSPRTPSLAVETSVDNTASPLLQSFMKRSSSTDSSNTVSPKQSKLSRLKQLCIASPARESSSHVTENTASQTQCLMSAFRSASLPSTPKTPTLSSGKKLVQCGNESKDSPLVARLARFTVPAAAPSGTPSQYKAHNNKTDSGTNSNSTSLDTDDPEHCTAANSGSDYRADHHSPGGSNNDTRAARGKRDISADDELSMPVQKRPRLDLNGDTNKENDSCLINVEGPKDSEVLQPLQADSFGLEGRVEDDPSEREDEAMVQGCNNLDHYSSASQKVETVAAEAASLVGEREEAMKESSVDPPIMSSLRASTSRRSIEAHGVTDTFLSRLLAVKKDPCTSNVPANETSRSTTVRNSLKKFLFSKLATENDKELEKKEDDDEDMLTTLAGTNHKEQSESIIPSTAPEAEASPSDGLTDPIVYYDDEIAEPPPSRPHKAVTVDCSLAAIRQALDHRRKEQEKAKNKKIERHFHAKIAPTDNKAAEDELNKVLSKDMFSEMQILGQFNLGFIITRLQSDLFIVDQHATDEKFNFETLQQTCVIQHQPLITPLDIELTPGNEAILLDNLEVFVTNGFQFDIDESRPFGHRVKLKSVPQSRNWSFGKEDVDELIFMLSDSPGSMCRPSRVRAMFASRACRTSVMVGTALTMSRMRQLIDNMGKIEQPWNCPHGRPTVRHLVNLDMISDESSCFPGQSTDT